MIVSDAMSRIDEVLNEKPLSESSTNNVPSDNSIILEHVSYSYDGEKNALKMCIRDSSYTGKISRVELQAGGTLERFGGKIGELVLSNAAYGSTSTGYGLKLWKGNTNACTIGKITDSTKSKSLTVNDLLGTNHAKCELYGEKDGAWSIVPKTEKISELTGYTAYKVQLSLIHILKRRQFNRNSTAKHHEG